MTLILVRVYCVRPCAGLFTLQPHGSSQPGVLVVPIVQTRSWGCSGLPVGLALGPGLSLRPAPGSSSGGSARASCAPDSRTSGGSLGAG